MRRAKLLLVSLGFAAIASAQNPLDEPWRLCDNAEGKFGAVASIGACTTIIDARTEPPRRLAKAHNNRGNAYAFKRDDDLAMADFDAAIRLDPKLAPAFYNRAVLRTALDDLPKAKADLDEAIHLWPNFAAAFLQRGIVNALSLQFDAAIADFDEVIRREPEAADAYLNRGYAKLEAGKKREGEADIAKAKSIDPTIDQ